MPVQFDNAAVKEGHHDLAHAIEERKVSHATDMRKQSLFAMAKHEEEERIEKVLQVQTRGTKIISA